MQVVAAGTQSQQNSVTTDYQPWTLFLNFETYIPLTDFETVTNIKCKDRWEISLIKTLKLIKNNKYKMTKTQKSLHIVIEIIWNIPRYDDLDRVK